MSDKKSPRLKGSFCAKYMRGVSVLMVYHHFFYAVSINM